MPSLRRPTMNSLLVAAALLGGLGELLLLQAWRLRDRHASRISRSTLS